MNELELIRDQLIGLRAQAHAVLRNVEDLIAGMKASEEEPKKRPRFLGDAEPTPENQS